MTECSSQGAPSRSSRAGFQVPSPWLVCIEPVCDPLPLGVCILVLLPTEKDSPELSTGYREEGGKRHVARGSEAPIGRALPPVSITADPDDSPPLWTPSRSVSDEDMAWFPGGRGALGICKSHFPRICPVGLQHPKTRGQSSVRKNGSSRAGGSRVPHPRLHALPDAKTKS